MHDICVLFYGFGLDTGTLKFDGGGVMVVEHLKGVWLLIITAPSLV